jgi:small-conductance mechanosensitive channel
MEKIFSIWRDWGVPVNVLLLIAGGFLISRIVRWVLDRFFIQGSQKLKVDPTRYKFMKNAASLIIWFLVFALVIWEIPRLKTVALTLFAGAGIFVAMAGFAAQHAFSNIISGVFIVWFRPFRVGDRIKVGSLDYGVVEDITLRHTIINNFENKRIIIPNSVISTETIINDSIEDAKVCRWVELSISYESDVEKAIEIIAAEAKNHPSSLDVRSRQQKEEGVPEIEVRLASLGDSGVNLRAFVWTADPFAASRMHSDLNRSIKKRFAAEGIEIPYPHIQLVNGK